MPAPSNIATAPQASDFAKTTTIAISIVLSAWAFNEMRIKSSSLDPRLKAAVDNFQYPESSSIRIHSTYTGNIYVDYGVRFLVTAFLPGATGFHDPAALVLSAYFLTSFFTLITIYAVEAGRAGAKDSVIYFTSIWAMLYQSVGGAVIIPLLHLFLLRQFWKPEYASGSNKLPIGYARALVPSLVLGYLLPTIAVYWPFLDPDLVWKQKIIAFWQITPFVVNILLLVLGQAFDSTHVTEEQAARIAQTNIRRIYLTCFTATSIAHFGVIYMKSTSQWNLSYSRIFVPQAQMLDHGVADPLHYIFQVDYIGIFASGLIMAFLALWFVSDIGHELSVGSGLDRWFFAGPGRPLSRALRVTLALAIGSIGVGPAATIALAFYARENRLFAIQARKKVA